MIAQQYSFNPQKPGTPPRTCIPDFSERFEKARKRAKLSQGAVAALVGVSTRTVESWSTGAKVPSEPARFEILRRLGANVKEVPIRLLRVRVHGLPKQARRYAWRALIGDQEYGDQLAYRTRAGAIAAAREVLAPELIVPVLRLNTSK